MERGREKQGMRERRAGFLSNQARGNLVLGVRRISFFLGAEYQNDVLKGVWSGTKLMQKFRVGQLLDYIPCLESE